MKSKRGITIKGKKTTQKQVLRIIWTCFFVLVATGCSTTKFGLNNTKPFKLRTFNFPQVIKIPRGENAKNDSSQVEKAINYISGLERDAQREFVLRDLFIKGNDLKEESFPSKASFAFKILIHFYPDSFEVHRDLVVSLIREGAFEEAEKSLEVAISKNFKQRSSFMLILAGLYSAVGKSDLSVKEYEKVLDIDKGNEEACIFLAKSLSNNGRSKKAVRILKNCSAVGKNNPIFFYYIGKIYLVEKNRVLADKYFKKALKSDPTYYQAVLGRGLIKEEEGKNKEAIRVYETFLKTGADNLVILNRLVQVLFTIEDFKKVIPYLEELVHSDQSNINLKVKLGILYTERKMFRKAVATFKEILKVAPNSDKVLYYLGALYQQLDEFDLAISHYNRITKESDLFFDSNLQISKLLRALVTAASSPELLNRIEKSVQKLGNVEGERAEAVKSSYIFAKAYYYGSKKRYDAAIREMKLITKMDLGQKYYLANLYDKDKKYKEAITLMMDVLEDHPENAQALNFIGYLMLENESDFDEAYALIKKAIEIEPNDAFIRDSLGWYFFKVGKFKKALVELKKAWNSEKKDVVISKHLAIVYQKLNNDLEAQKYFSEALKNCKEESQKREILDVMEKRILRRLPASLLNQ